MSLKPLIVMTRPCVLMCLSLVAISLGPKGSVRSIPAHSGKGNIAQTRYRYPLQNKRMIYGGRWAEQKDLPKAHHETYERISPFIEKNEGRYSPNLMKNFANSRFEMKKKLAFLPSYEPDYENIPERSKRRQNHASFSKPSHKLHLRDFKSKRAYYTDVGIPHYYPDIEDEKFYLNTLRRINSKGHSLMEKRFKRNAKPVEHSLPTAFSNSSHSMPELASVVADQKNNQKSPNNIELRSKRAFGQHDLYDSLKTDDRQALNDILTEEYFKAIARNVGNKRNENSIKYLEEKIFPLPSPEAISSERDIIDSLNQELIEAQDDLTMQAEEAMAMLSHGDSEEEVEAQIALRNILRRLQELHEAKEALKELQIHHERRILYKRAQDMNDEDEGYSKKDDASIIWDDTKKRAYNNLDGRSEDTMGERSGGELEKEENLSTIKTGENMKEDKKGNYDKLWKKLEMRDVLMPFFGSNRKEDCPVLERILTSCSVVSQGVNDDILEFVEPCLHHEICYMCGSGLDISQNECEIALSAGLEAKCDYIYDINGSLEAKMACLDASTLAYNILNDPARYDSKGACTFDPCIREFIDSSVRSANYY